MSSPMRLTALLMFAYIQINAVESISSFGKLFMVSLPKMFPDKSRSVTFYMVSMSTASEPSCLVLITSPHFKNGAELRSLELIRGNQITKTAINDMYISEVEIGKKNSLRLAGNASFSLTVVMEYKGTNASASFLAVPIEFWGTHYYAITLNGNPSIQIISSMAKNDIDITLRMTPVSIRLVYEGLEFNDGTSLLFTLDRWEAFSLSTCRSKTTPLEEGNMTGTFITGTRRIGVVSGNCLTPGITGRCYLQPTIEEGQILDIAAEMMHPVESHGMEFVIIVMLRRMQGYFYTIAETDQTFITVYERFNQTMTYVHAAGTVKLLGVMTCTVGDCEAFKVTASRPICVVYVAPSPCFTNDQHTAFEPAGSSGMAVIIPTTLFFWKYYFSQFTRFNEHIVVVIKITDMKSLYVDGLSYAEYSKNVYSISGLDTWKVVEIETRKKETLHVITTRAFSNFGCYAYDSVRNGTMISPIGFQRCEYLTRYTAVADDGIDNDCDGLIDEEAEDDADNDNDKLIDEDFKSGKRIHDEEKTTGIDLMQPTANPLACPPFHWGVFCRSCQGCIKECDKMTGVCSGCRHGYKNKRYGCDEECDENEYGEDCGGNCFDKCGKDCLNRETGECPSDHSKFVFLLLLIIPLVLVIWIMSTRCKMKSPQIIAEAMDTYMQENTTTVGS